MPSFSDCYSHMLKGTFLKSKLHYQCAMSLQVPCIPPLNKYCFYPGKEGTAIHLRTFPARLCQYDGGSRPLSSALAVFCSCAHGACAVAGPAGDQVQTALECFSEELSQAVYLKELEPGSGEGTGNGSGSACGAVDGEGGLSSGYVELLSGAAAGLWIQGKAEKLVDHVTVKDAKAPGSIGKYLPGSGIYGKDPILSCIQTGNYHEGSFQKEGMDRSGRKTDGVGRAYDRSR